MAGCALSRPDRRGAGIHLAANPAPEKRRIRL
jgi:hypothetical protein